MICTGFPAALKIRCTDVPRNCTPFLSNKRPAGPVHQVRPLEGPPRPLIRRAEPFVLISRRKFGPPDYYWGQEWTPTFCGPRNRSEKFSSNICSTSTRHAQVAIQSNIKPCIIILLSERDDRLAAFLNRINSSKDKPARRVPRGFDGRLSLSSQAKSRLSRRGYGENRSTIGGGGSERAVVPRGTVGQRLGTVMFVD